MWLSFNIALLLWFMAETHFISIWDLKTMYFLLWKFFCDILTCERWVLNKNLQ